MEGSAAPPPPPPPPPPTSPPTPPPADEYDSDGDSLSSGQADELTLREEVREMKAELGLMRDAIARLEDRTLSGLEALSSRLEMLFGGYGDVAPARGASMSLSREDSFGRSRMTSLSASSDKSPLGGGAGKAASLGGSSDNLPMLPMTDGPAFTLWVGTWNVGAKEPFEGVDGPRMYGELSHFVDSSHGLYIFGVQEAVSDAVFSRFAAYTNSVRLPLPPGSEGKGIVRGRGDGSFVSPKFTGIAVFARRDIAEHARVVAVHGHSFGRTEGSKGSAGVVVRVYSTTISAVSCHLASKKPLLRLAQYQDVCKVMGSKLGNEFFQLNEQSHHVIFMGDLNYRCRGLSGEDALRRLASGPRELARLRLDHDELTLQRRSHAVFHGYTEPRMAADFFPTYKRLEGAPAVDLTNPEWPNTVYQIAYKEPLYKGGRVKARVPGWCDRILYHSLPQCRGQLEPLLSFDGSGAPLPSYGTVHSHLAVSDHAPVFCVFNVALTGTLPPIPRPMTEIRDGSSEFVTDKETLHLMLLVRDIKVENRSAMTVPKVVKLLFPAPFEGGPDAGVTPPLRCSRTKDKVKGTVTWVANGTQAPNMHTLHLLVKVTMDKGIKGHCVVPISVVTSRLDEAGRASFTFFEPLNCDGLPRMFDRRQLHAQFTVDATIQTMRG